MRSKGDCISIGFSVLKEEISHLNSKDRVLRIKNFPADMVFTSKELDWLCDTWLQMYEALEHYEITHYTHDGYPCVHDDTAREVLKAIEQGSEK